ncbi:hypothetical protein H2509_04470 [Stappia sp. F7233]|uniref:Uncharacterized protein n=1 Tax=Stappia albiluteola TaxID=2758565 RepID=A0A839ABF9_9HYPH|nr:hypothetical protein [Stappia albiluteola]MBA5776378.1 hypothetical protein [Stappia albiluteola]
MLSRHILVQKIRAYLQALSPRAVDMLLRNLEASKARGETDPIVRLILEAGIELLRGEEEAVAGEPRGKWLRRLFFRPVECLLIDEALPHKQKGRITRSSLVGIWTMIERDFVPELIEAAERQVQDPALSEAEAASIAGHLRDAVTPDLRRFINDMLQDEKLRQRMTMVMGGERVYLDLFDVVDAFEAEAWLTPFLDSLPEKLSDWDLKSDSPAAQRVKAATGRHAENAALIAAAILGRAENPAGVAALASNLARTQDAKKIADSPYAAFVDVVLSEAERLYIVACKRPDAESDITSALSHYHALMRGIDRDIDFSCGGKWYKRLAETRRQFSELVSAELEAAVSHVRRALKVPAVDADGKPLTDRISVEEAKRALGMLALMRVAAESLAVNEVTARTRQTVEQTLEIMTRKLLADAAKCTAEEKPAHLAAVDVAIELCEGYFGKDYAGLLRRSRRAAESVQKPKSKVARGG